MIPAFEPAETSDAADRGGAGTHGMKNREVEMGHRRRVRAPAVRNAQGEVRCS